MLKLQEINTFDEFQNLEPIWNDLLSQSDSDFPFLTFEWLTCWWKVYGKKSRLLILLAKDGDEIAGMAPLMITKTKWRGLPLRAITFAANYNSNRSGLMLIKKKKEAVRRILDHLINNYNYDIIWFDFIVKDSDTDRSLKEVLDEKKIKYVQYKSNVSPYVAVEASWEAYNKGRSKNIRKTLRKNYNRLKRHGNYEIVRYTNSGIDKAIEDILKISSNSWKYNNGTSIVDSRQSIDFYSSIARIASAKNWLNIMMLNLNGDAVAFNLMLTYKDKIYSLQTAYDERYHLFSPGSILMDQAIRDTFEENFKEIDLLGDFEPHKTRWTSLGREHNKYWIFGRSVYGRILDVFESYAMPLIRALMKNKNDLTSSSLRPRA